MDRFRPMTRCLCMAAVAALLGCQKWTPVENPRPVLVGQVALDSSERGYFGFRTGSSPTVTGRVAAIDADSVWLTTGSESTSPVLLDDRTLVELRETDWVSTGLGVLGLAALVGLFAFALSDSCCPL